MEILAFVLGVLLEKLRPDLKLRRWWAVRRWHLPVTLPALGGRSPVPVALAGLDARRLLLRPTTLVLAYVLYRVFWPALPATDVYEGVNRLVGITLALLGLAAMVVVASLSGRDRGVEIVAALPGSNRSRVLSWVLLLSALAVLEYALLALLRFGRTAPSYAALLPDLWELAQGPVMLLGGGLLGLVLARLLPAWVAVPACLVVTLVWVGVLSGTFQQTTMLTPVIEWIQYHEDGRVVVEPGSFAWHNGYLLGLCGLGVVAALLREPGPRRALVVAGTVLTAATVVAGALALP